MRMLLGVSAQTEMSYGFHMNLRLVKVTPVNNWFYQNTIINFVSVICGYYVAYDYKLLHEVLGYIVRGVFKLDAVYSFWGAGRMFQ